MIECEITLRWQESFETFSRLVKLEIIEDFNFSFDPEKIQRFLTRKKSFFLIFLIFFFTYSW